MDNSKESLKERKKNTTKYRIYPYGYMNLEIMQRIINFKKMAAKYKVLLPSEKLLEEMHTKRMRSNQNNTVSVPLLKSSSLSVAKSKGQLWC